LKATGGLLGIAGDGLLGYGRLLLRWVPKIVFKRQLLRLRAIIVIDVLLLKGFSTFFLIIV